MYICIRIFYLNLIIINQQRVFARLINSLRTTILSTHFRSSGRISLINDRDDRREEFFPQSAPDFFSFRLHSPAGWPENIAAINCPTYTNSVESDGWSRTTASWEGLKPDRRILAIVSQRTKVPKIANNFPHLRRATLPFSLPFFFLFFFFTTNSSIKEHQDEGNLTYF